MDFSAIRAITFDCYGTLIDWESGILDALRPILEDNEIKVTDDRILALYSEFEPEAQSGGYMEYRAVLRSVMYSFASRFGFSIEGDEAHALANSLPHWQPFPDTVAALQELKKHYKLAILSNIDDDLFADSAVHLEVPFDAIITAQQVRSYKPGKAHFAEALERLDLEPHQILHAAESLYHDVATARPMGFRTVWVNRHACRPGSSAARVSDVQPEFTVPNLTTLVRILNGIESSTL